MRKLLYIPIVHAPEDLGSYMADAKKEYISRYGLSGWNDHNEALGKFWQELSGILLALVPAYAGMDYMKVKLYQDGLPVCGREFEIVEKLAHNGNRNYKLLYELVKKGATVMGSEDPKLLIEERDRLKIPPAPFTKGEHFKNGAAGSYDDLMERRDEYIAQRIASTLKDGETGLLFIGALHRVVEKLPEDIQVERVG